MIKKILLVLTLLSLSIGGYSEVRSGQLKIEQANESFIDVEKAKIFCRTIGKGKPLIVIHGGPGLNQDYLLPQPYTLAENNFVIFFDQRGSGKSTGEINQDTTTIPLLVKDLESIRKAFNLKTVSLLGHSWGGLLAMHYAIEHPESVDKLILSNSAPASSDELALFANEYVRRTSDFQGELTKIQNTQGFQNGDPELREQVNRIILRTYCHIPKNADLLNIRMSPSAAINGAKINQIFWDNTLAKPFDLHEALKKLRILTLIIHGDDDPIPVHTAEHLHKSIVGSKYVVLKDCGHFPYVEQPEGYFQSVNEFLKGKLQ